MYLLGKPTGRSGQNQNFTHRRILLQETEESSLMENCRVLFLQADTKKKSTVLVSRIEYMK